MKLPTLLLICPPVWIRPKAKAISEETPASCNALFELACGYWKVAPGKRKISIVCILVPSRFHAVSFTLERRHSLIRALGLNTSLSMTALLGILSTITSARISLRV